VTYSGAQVFPRTITVALGAGTGTITLNYQAYNVPDKFVVTFDGAVVIDTGYRGRSSYQSQLNSELASRGYPAETIQGTGSGSMTFNKTSATTSATVDVYGPLPDTAWELTLSCPPSASAASAVRELVTSDQIIEIDPLLNVSATNSAIINLDKGKYVATLRTFGAQINGRHFADLALSYVEGGENKQVRFLNKGKFDSLIAAKSAYEGLTLSFEHDGGEVGGFFHMIPTANVSGSVIVDFTKEAEIELKAKPTKSAYVRNVKKEEEEEELICRMNARHFAWYKRGWESGKCCGVIINIAGQNYIVVKRSIGDDTSCGGGEKEDTPCIEQLSEIGYPAFAWPTLDGKTFAPLSSSQDILFKYDKELSDTVISIIRDQEYTNAKGNPAGHRHLMYQMDIVLFPVG